MNQRRPSRPQLAYLRSLERACDEPPAVGLTPKQAAQRTASLESLYKIIYNRQPVMRGR